MFRKLLKTMIGILLLVFITGCSIPLQGVQQANSSVDTDISGRVSFQEIYGQGFMGGSVLYNPENPSTGQLTNGATVAIRLGQLEKEAVNYDEIVFTDIPEQASFGSLYITEISDNALSFDVQLYNHEGEYIGNESYSLNIDEQIDINDDGAADLEYKKPLRKRPGFESAIYLTFLSSQQNLKTSMFALMAEQYSRGVLPSGIIGINPNGQFIIRKYEDSGNSRSSNVLGAQRGDYVVDTLSGSYQRITDSTFSRSARSVTDIDVENIEEESGPVIPYFESNEFNNLFSSETLFNSLPDITKEKVFSTDSNINKLNEVLELNDLIIDISSTLENNPIPEEIFEEVVSQIDQLNTDELVQLNRYFLEEAYPGYCPRFVNVAESFVDIFPLTSVSFGTPGDSNIDDFESRATSASQYSREKKALDAKYKQYNEFFKMPLKSPDIPLFGGKVKVEFQNSYFALGFKGSFSSTWGSIKSSVEGVVYITGDTNIDSKISFEKDIFNKPLFNYSNPVYAIGPLVLSLNANVTVKVPLKVNVVNSSAFNMRAAFTGLYGAGFNLGLKYGVKWKRKWFIRYPAPYANFSGKGLAHNKTIYLVDSESDGSIKFDNAGCSIKPQITAGIGADISKVVWGDLSAGTGINSYLNVNYKKPYLKGTAGVDFFINSQAEAAIGLKNVPMIGFLGKKWKWDLLKYNKNLATWTIFNKKM